MKDINLCWQEYSDLYSTFEMETLAGACYSTIAPSRDYSGENIWFLGNKFQLKNKENQIIGTETHIIEITNPKLIQLNQLLQKIDLYRDKKTSHYSIGKMKERINLSKRQNECLFFILRGKTTKEIANILNVSIRTIESHLEEIKIKFRCRTKSELIIKAIEEGFMEVIPRSIFSESLLDKLT